MAPRSLGYHLILYSSPAPLISVSGVLPDLPAKPSSGVIGMAIGGPRRGPELSFRLRYLSSRKPGCLGFCVKQG